MFKVVLACLAVGAAAFSPAAAGSRIVQSQVVASAAPLAEPMVARAPIVSMSAVTERDADGNPVVHTDMYAAACKRKKPLASLRSLHSLLRSQPARTEAAVFPSLCLADLPAALHPRLTGLTRSISASRPSPSSTCCSSSAASSKQAPCQTDAVWRAEAVRGRGVGWWLRSGLRSVQWRTDRDAELLRGGRQGLLVPLTSVE